jgi:hypothetical protein
MTRAADDFEIIRKRMKEIQSTPTTTDDVFATARDIHPSLAYTRQQADAVGEHFNCKRFPLLRCFFIRSHACVAENECRYSAGSIRTPKRKM